MIQEAMGLFKGKFPFQRRVNCAVAIGTTFTKKCPLTEEILNTMKNMGHGKAPGKVCGAYYAAKKIISENRPHLLKNLDQHFINNAGSTVCREIKKNRFSCEKCVMAAAEFLNTNCGT